jgi:phenylalanyl-tRNA synthetase beta chain
MPQSVLSARRVLEALAPHVPDRDAIVARLFDSKAELAGWKEDALTVEATADRLDLLSEGGLGFALAGLFDRAHGLAPMPTSDEPAAVFRVDPSVDPIRPAIAGVVVRAPHGHALDEGLLAEAIRVQELLHATLGLDRRAASLGIYPLGHLNWPIRYGLEPLDAVRFVPLDGTDPIDARGFFSAHAMAARYGSLGRVGDACLTLRDSTARVLSLPPVLNSRDAGKARAGERGILIESTGTRPARVRESAALLSLPFVARGWSLAPVRTEGFGGPDSGERIVRPRALPLSSRTVAAVVGRELTPEDVERALARVRLSAERTADGWAVSVPPWRPDLRAEVDLVEEVVLGRGLRTEESTLPPSATRGRRRPERRFRDRVRERLLGLGFVPLHTTVLVSEAMVRRFGREDSAIALANPVSESFARVRDELLLSLAASLERNVRSGYPQRLSEVGAVVVRDPKAESGGATRHRAAALAAHDGAGFADAAALVDYLLRAFGAMGVREPVAISGTIPGRAARVRVAGETVAELGELHPSVLTELRVPVPAAWAELDLDALWPLVRTETGL